MVAAGVALGFLATAYPLAAQEISESHIRAARAAIVATQATQEFDLILPEAALALKSELIQKNPDLQSLINSTVDEQAVALAPRRADLQREIAIMYARSFTEEELRTIAEFYGSETGQKLLESGPTVMREVFNAVEIWQNGMARDLAQNVANALQKEVDRPIDTDVDLEAVIQ
jgi:hypothetical protein